MRGIRFDSHQRHFPFSCHNECSKELFIIFNEDHCFQCQEHGYIARNCPNIRCFRCDEYGHIVMDCPHRIPLLGAPAKHHQSKLHKSHYTRSGSRQCCEDRDRQSHSRSQSCFHRHHSSSHYDSYRGCSTS